MKRVVITGIGMISPCGNSKEEFWDNYLSGKSFITAYNEYPEMELKSRVQGKVQNFEDFNYLFSSNEMLRMGKHTRFAIAATDMAINDSKLDLSTENVEKIGLCIGNAIGDTPYCEEQFREINNKKEKKINKYLYSKCMFSGIVTEISSRYSLKGSGYTMSTGCTSGIDSVGYGFEVISKGLNDIEMMICGATEAPITPMTYSSFDAINALTESWDIPENASTPFDLNRDGFVLAEGCGILLLEEYEHAKKRNANIYCEILSFATENNALHMTDLKTDGETLANVISDALIEAKVLPKDISYISAHGSSTQQNDLFETNAYKKVFENGAYNIPISSGKSQAGHPLGAASALELVCCCMIFKKNKIPPTVNLTVQDPLCDLDYVSGQGRDLKVRYILKDASGFSGIHSAMVLKADGESEKWGEKNYG